MFGYDRSTIWLAVFTGTSHDLPKVGETLPSFKVIEMWIGWDSKVSTHRKKLAYDGFLKKRGLLENKIGF